jgi:uncharacterized membrane protein HdeD (DUF308 family)
MHHIMARFWWILALRGLLGILLGLAALVAIGSIESTPMDLFGLGIFFKPAAVVATLLLLIGLYAMVDGLFAFLLGIQDYGEGRRWGSLAGEGMVSMVLGLSIWIWPGATLFLLYGITAWAVVTGILQILQGLDLNEYKDRRGPFFLAGLCSIAFGLAIALFHSGLTLAWLMGTFAFLSGVPLLVLAVRLRHFAKSGSASR